MKIGIIDLCKQIEDPRMNRKKVHKMETIIYISIAAVICGAQSWNEIEEFGNAKIAFFKSRIPDLEFIPSHDTFNRFFSIIKPEYFELIFRNWVKQVCQEVKGVVAIDGKLGHGSQVDEGLAGFNARFDDACSQQQPATGICRAAGDGREGRGEEPAGGGERDGYACPGFRADTFELSFYSSDEEIADGAGRLCALRC